MQTPASASGNSTADTVISILLLFSDQRPVWTAVEMAQQMDMPRSTMYRYLNSLKKGKMVTEQGDGVFKLGPQVQILANVAKSSTSFIEIVRDHMLRLSAQFNETVLFNELVDYNIATLERIECRQQIRMAATRGSLLPWPATPSSKLFLAYSPEQKISDFWPLTRPQAYTPHTIVERDALVRELEKIKAQGYAYSDEERDLNVIGVAVPINSGNECRYCLSIVAPKYRIDAATLENIRDALLEAAREIKPHYFQ